MMWREWLLRVVGDGHITLQSFVHPSSESEAKCDGFVENFYGNPQYQGTCVIPPYAGAMYLNATKDAAKPRENPQAWTVSPSGNGGFELIASNRPDSCLRRLAVEDCRTMPTLVESPVKYFPDSKKYTTWRLTKRYSAKIVESPSPSPVPSPSPTNPSPVPIPMPCHHNH